MRSRYIRLGVALLAGLIWLVSAPSAVAQDEPTRSIQNIAGDVYYFRNNNHYGVFAVTSSGVILVDPISRDAGEWLKGEITQQFGQTVRTIVYSHHDGDHAGGAEAYEDTVEEIIAQENAPAGIVLDDRVSVMPTRTFSGRLDVTLGGKTIELIELGPGHTDSLIAVRFPEERVLFVVDIFSGKRLPFNGIAPTFDVDTVVGTLRHIEKMYFDILAPGHTACRTSLSWSPTGHSWRICGRRCSNSGKRAGASRKCKR